MLILDKVFSSLRQNQGEKGQWQWVLHEAVCIQFVSLVAQLVKVSACNSEDLDSIPGLGRSLGGGHGNPLQYSCLANPHEQRTLVGYRPWGHRVGHNWATKHTCWNYVFSILGVKISGLLWNHGLTQIAVCLKKKNLLWNKNVTTLSFPEEEDGFFLVLGIQAGNHWASIPAFNLMDLDSADSTRKIADPPLPVSLSWGEGKDQPRGLRIFEQLSWSNWQLLGNLSRGKNAQRFQSWYPFAGTQNTEGPVTCSFF